MAQGATGVHLAAQPRGRAHLLSRLVRGWQRGAHHVQAVPAHVRSDRLVRKFLLRLELRSVVQPPIRQQRHPVRVPAHGVGDVERRPRVWLHFVRQLPRGVPHHLPVGDDGGLVDVMYQIMDGAQSGPFVCYVFALLILFGSNLVLNLVLAVITGAIEEVKTRRRPTRRARTSTTSLRRSRTRPRTTGRTTRATRRTSRPGSGRSAPSRSTRRSSSSSSPPSS